MARPAASPIAAGAAPNNKNKVEPKMKWTSDTPTGIFGRTSKKNTVNKAAMMRRRANAKLFDWRSVSTEYLIVKPAAPAVAA